jgi:RNA polymerase sigma-70 factor (ECF subfamily)
MADVERFAAPVDAAAPAASVDDREHVRRAQARDMWAFEQLYHANLNRVYAVCLRMTANVTHAEELTQRTFLTAWEKLPLFRGESAFSSWLHRVAVNTVLAHLRAEHRREARVFGTDDPAIFETACATAPAGIRLDLDAAIGALPPQARAVFVLHDVEGWRHAEIAAELGVTTGTTKAQLHRARKLLQEALQ